MRMPLWVAGPCIILGAVLGALVAWGLSGERAAAPVPVSDEPAFADKPWNEPPRGDGPLPALPPPVVSHELQPEVSSTEAPGRPEPAPVPVFAVGDGVITGRVIDQQRRGVPDAEVVLVLSTDHEAPRPPQRRDFDSDAGYHDAFLHFTAQRLRHESAVTRRAITDEDGSFALEGLPDAEGRISASADGYRFPSRREMFGVKPGAEITIEGVRLGRLRVVAAYPDGSAPVSGTVRFQREDSGGSPVSRPWERLEEGGVELDPGTYRVSFNGREPPGEGLSDSVEVRAGEDAEVRLDLSALGRVLVALDFAAQRPVSCQLTVYRAADDGSRGARAASRTVRSPAISAEVGDFEPGDYLFVLRSGASDIAEQRVSVRAGIQDTRLRAGEPDGFEYVDAVVNVPASGAWRAESASLRLSGPIQSSDSWHLGENRFRIYYSMRQGRGGNVTASASVGGLGSISKVIEPGRDRVVEFTFEEPATLTVRVANLPSTFLATQVRLQVAADDGTARMTSSRTTPVPGKPGEALVRFNSMQPMSGKVRFSSNELSRVPGLEMAVQLQPGHSEVEWTLPTLHELGVTVDLGEGVTNVSLRLSDAADKLIGTRTARRGGQRVSFNHLPPGSYLIRISARGSTNRDYPLQLYNSQEIGITVRRD